MGLFCIPPEGEYNEAMIVREGLTFSRADSTTKIKKGIFTFSKSAPIFIADKNLATMIGQQGRISGMGVVDTTQNKTFNQSLSALSGLDSLIKSGAVDPNAKVTDVIGNKKSASLVLRAFGSTQPDNIAQVLGAGGASVPNLDTMTMGQAADFLKNSVYTAMGTNTTAQRYAMNPSLASTDLQTYYQSSPINALAVEKSYSSFPNLTPSQRMQLLNPQ